MPELPEVETVRTGLAPALEGALIARVEQRRPDLRFAFPENFAARLTGKKVEHLSRRAKYLLGWLSGGEVLVMHLGMTGRFTVFPPSPPLNGSGQRKSNGQSLLQDEAYHEAGNNPAHDHVIFHLGSGAKIVYNDARRFGYMTLVDGTRLEAHKLFKNLGVEPLGDGLTPAYLASRAAGKQVSLKAFLMDQRIVAGLGNIYVCEALYRAGLSPRRGAGCLVTAKGRPTARAERLAAAIKSVLGEAIAAGGSTLRDYQHTDGSLGYFQHAFKVYDRNGARCQHADCGETIRRIVQNGRSTFYCPSCQK